jgi:hypothetical protein
MWRSWTFKKLNVLQIPNYRLQNTDITVLFRSVGVAITGTIFNNFIGPNLYSEPDLAIYLRSTIDTLNISNTAESAAAASSDINLAALREDLVELARLDLVEQLARAFVKTFDLVFWSMLAYPIAALLFAFWVKERKKQRLQEDVTLSNRGDKQQNLKSIVSKRLPLWTNRDK